MSQRSIDRDGLAALGRLDELGMCEAYMAGSLNVVGDMLRFVSFRNILSDSHPLDYLWRRMAPLLIGRSKTNRQAIATHYEFDTARTIFTARLPRPREG